MPETGPGHGVDEDSTVFWNSAESSDTNTEANSATSTDVLETPMVSPQAMRRRLLELHGKLDWAVKCVDGNYSEALIETFKGITILVVLLRDELRKSPDVNVETQISALFAVSHAVKCLGKARWQLISHIPEERTREQSIRNAEQYLSEAKTILPREFPPLLAEYTSLLPFIRVQIAIMETECRKQRLQNGVDEAPSNDEAGQP